MKQYDSATDDILFDDDARKNIFIGIKTVYDAVSCTLGPKGKNVIIEKVNALPSVTKDGVTVAKAIKLRNRSHALGAELVKEVASQTNDEAGDGTTTATVLTYALCNEALKLLSVGHSAVDIKRGMELAVNTIIDELKKTSIAINNEAEIAHVATVSANGAVSIGSLVADAMKAVGNEGVITIEHAKGTETSLEVIDGLKFNRGYLSSYFVTKQNKMVCEFADPYVLITDKEIKSLDEIITILELVHKARASLLIIADDINGEALQGLVVNKLKATLDVCAVKAPSYGEDRCQILHDIAALTGGTAHLNAVGTDFKNITLNDLGRCKKIIVDKTSSTLICDNNDDLEQRIKLVKESLNNPSLSQQEYKQIKRRAANLSNGAAILYVGGSTEIEMLERKDRIEDALNATRAAIEEGIISGGGIALIRAIKILDTLEYSECEAPGIQIVRKACLKPFYKIMENIGTSPDVIIDNILKHESTTYGYNAFKNEYCDMFEAGIVDPVKVTRCALKNAISIASMFITLECAIFDDCDGVNSPM